MEFLNWLVDFFLHLDRHLAEVIRQYGGYTYALLFLVIFLETGLVVAPLLPGDSLLFAAGSFAGLGALNPWLLFALLSVAAILGDTVNYAIGAYLGPKVFHFPKSRFFNPEHLRKTHEFYEKYGGKTIIIARFVPIIRTFAPFVAGIGAMSYARFLLYNVVGGSSGWGYACSPATSSATCPSSRRTSASSSSGSSWSRSCRRWWSTCGTGPGEARGLGARVIVSTVAMRFLTPAPKRPPP